MKKYVQIQSSINIAVTSGLQAKDFTNLESDIPNRMKVSAEWPKTTILVKKGQHWYPSEIAEWPTVKSLVDSGVMTIGIDSDEKSDSTDADEFRERLKEIGAKIAEQQSGEEPVRQKRAYHRRSLEEVAGNDEQ